MHKGDFDPFDSIVIGFRQRKLVKREALAPFPSGIRPAEGSIEAGVAENPEHLDHTENV